MRILKTLNPVRPTVLQKLAGNLEPTVEERAKAFDDELTLATSFVRRQQLLNSRFSNAARWLKPAASIKGFAKALGAHIIPDSNKRVPQPTSGKVKMFDGETMIYFTDGSVRHGDPVIKGKATVKVFKRMRREARRRGLSVSA